MRSTAHQGSLKASADRLAIVPGQEHIRIENFPQRQPAASRLKRRRLVPFQRGVYLGIDHKGTSGVKALLIDDAQTSSGRPTYGELDVPRLSGWSEQDPRGSTPAGRRLTACTAREGSFGDCGIGLSGQMHGATLLDGADQVLRPCILGTIRAAIAKQPHSMPTRLFITGNIVFPGLPRQNRLGLPITDDVHHRALPARCCCRRITFASG